MAAIDELVENLVSTTFDNLPVDVLEPTKVQILDTVGVAVAGTSFGTVDPLIDLVKEWGGKKEATILVYGDRVPAPNAALVNGYLAAVLDYDDTDDRSVVHISTAIVMPGFAMAECIGSVSGKDFIAAVALGFDLSARLGRAQVPKLRWTPVSQGSNYFGSAAVCGKLLNLSEAKIRNALGIVMEEVSPGNVGYTEGVSSKGAWGGLTSRAGINAALLAERGMIGVSDPIEGKRGFYQGFRKMYIPEILTANLGKVYAGTTNSIKLYPCCRVNGNSLDATLALVHEHDIKPQDVTEIVFHVGPYPRVILFEPRDIKYNPQNPIQCQFSLPWTAASAIVHRKVGIDNFTKQALQDKRVLGLAQKVTHKLNPEFATATCMEPVIVEIEMKSGEVHSKRVDESLGSPENPASWDIIADKFRDCCAHAIKPIPQSNVEKVIKIVESLEDVADVTQIVRLLV